MTTLIKNLNDIILEYEKLESKDQINLKEEDLEILFHEDNYNYIADDAKNMLFSKKDLIISILNDIFMDKNLIVNIDVIKKQEISENTYKIIYKFLFDNNYRIFENSDNENFSTLNSYFKDLNNYPRFTNEEQRKYLLLHDTYLKRSNEYKKNIISYYSNIIGNINNSYSDCEITYKKIARYQINLLLKLIEKNEIFFDKEEMQNYLNEKVRKFILNKSNHTNDCFDFDINDYINNDISLTKNEVVDIYKKLLENEKERLEIKKIIVEHNLKLVISIAKHYKDNKNNIPFVDLIQEGNLGLIRALDKYDINSGAFSTYASWWIKQHITRSFIDKGKMIRVPVHFSTKISKYTSFFNSYYDKHLEKPSDELVIKELKITKEELKDIKFYITEPSSLNDPIGEEEHGVTSEVGDFIEDEKSNVENEILDTCLKNDVLNLLNNLKDHQAIILILRFGLVIEKPLIYSYKNIILLFTSEKLKENEVNDYLIENKYCWVIDKLKDSDYKFKIIHTTGRPMTLESIGQIFGITRERIRQIEAKSLNSLRNPKIFKKLNYFYEE